jgi:hypothetical protein
MIIGEKNTDLKRLTGRLKLRFLTEILLFGTNCPYDCRNNCRAHQTRRSGRLLRLGFNEIAQFLSKSEVLVALSIFSSPYFLHQYSHKRRSHVPEMPHYRMFPYLSQK